MHILSPVYNEIKRLRSTGACAAAISLLRTHRPTSEDDAFEAVVCLFVCGDIDSAVHVCQTHAWEKQWALQAARALTEMLQSGEVSRALSLAKTAVSDPDAPHDVAAIYLLLLQANGQVDAADVYIRNHLPDPPAGETFLLTIMAEIAAATQNWRRAYKLASAVLSADPDDFRALMTLSAANHANGNIHEALGNALRARLINGNAPAAILQIMRCQNSLGDYYAVIAAFDGLDPQSVILPDFHVELGTAYAGLEDRSRAIAEYRAALASGAGSQAAIRALLKIHAAAGDTAALDALIQTYPAEIRDDPECQHTLGLGYLARREVDRAAHLFRDALALSQKRGEARTLLPWPVPEPRIRHDYEQLELLQQRGRLDDAGRRALKVLKHYCDQPGNLQTTFAPSGPEALDLEHALCAIHHIPEPSFAGRTLGENDYNGIEEKYFADRMVVIDDFLTPEALAALRCFCEEATVWKMYNDRGYVGALLSQGFSSRVLLAIADELRQIMPRVIADHPLMQAWGFKYDQRMQGINLHADFARVNVNFWITPNHACMDPTTGGMIIYDLPAPQSWTFADYNTGSDKLAAFLKVHHAKSLRVPYRENRCVLFDSSLIHVTDEMHFEPGYENRRVNVTLLYGRARSIE